MHVLYRISRRIPGRACAAVAALALLLPVAQAQTGDDLILDARAAWQKGDRAKLSALRSATLFAEHPLAAWVDYWDLTSRLAEAQPAEVEAFYRRWSGSYLEDRLRNDWLLELGKRRDWANFVRDYPRFRMNDDREVVCYARLTEHLAGRDVRQDALTAWYAQREADDGCALLAQTLFAAGRFGTDDVWQQARLAFELERQNSARGQRSLRSAVQLLGPETLKAVDDALANPARLLARSDVPPSIALVALLKLGANDPAGAAAQLAGGWDKRLTARDAAFAWAFAGKWAAVLQQPQGLDYYRRAWALNGAAQPSWSDDTLAWGVRAGLRAAQAPDRWALIARAIDALSPAERSDAAWVYWRARAMAAQAAAGAAGDADRSAARAMLQTIAGQQGFYGQLAAEDLGQPIVLMPPPRTLAAPEREAAAANAGFGRALRLLELGLRSEGVREWNFTRRGLGDRELLAAAALACEHEAWDLCINTSERTRAEVDLAQRFPTPHRARVLQTTRGVGIDPAYVYGLMRQESRFITTVRSGAGASGLMQVMPGTARIVARRIGLDFKPAMLTDPDTNLLLGTSYLKMVLDDFAGSQPLATAGYNAGPNRPRRWRDAPVVEPAAWIEAIPIGETRDYVKKVLSNAVYYGALLGAQPPSLKARLGSPIGPPDPGAPPSDRELP
ncbi:lytic transglycosylase [Rubrivivax gelatinosus]|nr:lytic transglycosylase [Rubrivivax gelatinosus]